MADIIQKCEIRKLLIWVIGQGSVCSSCLPQPLLTHPWAASQPVSLPGSPPAFLLPFLGSPLLAPTAGGQWHMKCMRNIIGVYNANYLSRQHLTKAWVWHGKKKKQYGSLDSTTCQPLYCTPRWKRAFQSVTSTELSCLTCLSCPLGDAPRVSRAGTWGDD